MDGPVSIAQQVHDRRPVVQVDHDWPDAGGRDGAGLGVAPNEHGHLVPVLPQFTQHVRSDESRCAGECDLHGFSFA